MHALYIIKQCRNVRIFITRIFFISLFCILCVSHISDVRAASYFKMREQRSGNIQPFPKWTSMIARYKHQNSHDKSQQCTAKDVSLCTTKALSSIVSRVRDKAPLQQLIEINSWGNAHPYIEDNINWGMEDYWETPREFIDISGDCEDYAISKYYLLRAVGFSPEDLRIIILEDLNLGGIIHAVLGVYINDVLYILDNQSTEVTAALSIYHYRPIFGINEQAWWAYYPINN